MWSRLSRYDLAPVTGESKFAKAKGQVEELFDRRTVCSLSLPPDAVSSLYTCLAVVTAGVSYGIATSVIVHRRQLRSFLLLSDLSAAFLSHSCGIFVIKII